MAVSSCRRAVETPTTPEDVFTSTTSSARFRLRARPGGTDTSAVAGNDPVLGLIVWRGVRTEDSMPGPVKVLCLRTEGGADVVAPGPV